MPFRDAWLLVGALLVLVGFGASEPAISGVGFVIIIIGGVSRVWSRHLFDRVTLVRRLGEHRAFTGESVEYASGRTGELSYSFDNGQLLRRVTLPGTPPATTVVMDELLTDTATSRFLYRNRTGEKDVPAASATEVRSIQIEFVPRPSARQSAGLVTGRNTPFASALVQLRNIGS